MDISHLRENYTKSGLSRESLSSNPYEQFELWFQQAKEAELPEPNAMSLATVSPDGRPSLRTVLLKYIDESGFVFFTNYSSRKAKDIDQNPHVSLLFTWLPLERQIKISGTAEKISRTATLKYFSSRPHGSQLGAWVSHQSAVISSRQMLEMKLDSMKRKFKEGKVPLPDFWGGYKVTPVTIEFWQGRSNRLHDRFQYTLDDSSSDNKKWSINRLAP